MHVCVCKLPEHIRCAKADSVGVLQADYFGLQLRAQLELLPLWEKYEENE